MTRLPALDRTDLAPEHHAVYDEISRTRGGMPTSFRVFLNHPATARAIADYGHYLRFDVGLPDRYTELAVMRTAALTGDTFMWAHHAELAAAAGLTPADLEDLKAAPPGSTDDPVLSIVDATVTATGDDASFEAARRHLGDATALDVAVLTGYFVMLHHVFTALGIQGTADTRGKQ
jgi:alkylhydroperoxidase family enzyme